MTTDTEKNQTKQQQQDHDLLIRIDQKLGDLIDDVNELKTNIVGRVANLEDKKLSKDDFEKYKQESSKENEVHLQEAKENFDANKKWRWSLAGGLAVVSFIGIVNIINLFSK